MSGGPREIARPQSFQADESDDDDEGDDDDDGDGDDDDESDDIYYDEVYVCDIFVYSEVSARGAKQDTC